MKRTAAEIRKNLSHPVIDADGHWIEFGPLLRDELRRIGGDLAVEGYNMFPAMWEQNLKTPMEERLVTRVPQGPWWTHPARNTRDRATAMMPQLLRERMDELGFDFAVLYPSAGHRVAQVPDARTRQAACRAFNTFTAEYFGRFADRMTPAAVIPMHTPDEAIAELEYVVKQLGMKVASLRNLIPRRAPSELPKRSGTDGEWADFSGVAPGGVWYDLLGIDSAYDYDPVWAKCLELGISPTFHSGSSGIGTRTSPSNFTFNHIGHFAAANEGLCRALFLGGVTRRFPKLKFGFLEGGVGWACQLFADLIGHWEKRNREALEHVNPHNVDAALLLQLARQYGARQIVEALEKPAGAFDLVTTPVTSNIATGAGEVKDDYAACRVRNREELAGLFVDNFYFGCEADDPMNAAAFDRALIPLGRELRVLLGSDIGHFDVPDMAGVLPEAYELLEDGLLSEAGFRSFVYENAVRFYGEANPDFFKGTEVAPAADATLASSKVS